MTFWCDKGLELSFQNQVLSGIWAVGLELGMDYQDESDSGLEEAYRLSRKALSLFLFSFSLEGFCLFVACFILFFCVCGEVGSVSSAVGKDWHSH